MSNYYFDLKDGLSEEKRSEGEFEQLIAYMLDTESFQYSFAALNLRAYFVYKPQLRVYSLMKMSKIFDEIFIFSSKEISKSAISEKKK